MDKVSTFEFYRSFIRCICALYKAQIITALTVTGIVVTAIVGAMLR